MSDKQLPASNAPAPSRRDFLASTAAAAVGGTLVSALANPPAVHAAGSDILKVGLIGCGSRGSSASLNAMRADANAQITVLCDVFPDNLQRAKQSLAGPLGKQFAVKDDHCFSGFDGYKEVMKSDVDVVLLCTTPAFRPVHLKAALEAGKHVFCEKPVAVDAPGVRSCLQSTALASAKNLNLVSGLCWRYDYGVKATMAKIFDGAIGDVVAIQENYLTGPLWHRGRKPEWTEMEYQMRNWYYFTWLSGDHNVEQHIHSLDKAMWLNRDVPPLSCFGLGGRQVRTGPDWGNIYDHHAVCYEWASGVKCFAYTRQQSSECSMDVDDYVLGTKGRATVLKNEIVSGTDTWKYKYPGPGKNKPDMYDVEHVELFNAIRSGKPINNGIYMSYSTLLAIMGRMACYTGQKITWEMAMNSQESLVPEKLEWGPGQKAEVAMPGTTKFV